MLSGPPQRPGERFLSTQNYTGRGNKGRSIVQSKPGGVTWSFKMRKKELYWMGTLH